jgi:hypothetical protein
VEKVVDWSSSLSPVLKHHTYGKAFPMRKEVLSAPRSDIESERSVVAERGIKAIHIERLGVRAN